MFNVDVNARRADYSNLTDEQLLVTKIFATLQGEGPQAGQFAIFVRFSGCNLGKKESCIWCDSLFRLHEGYVMTFDEILSCAEKLRLNRQRFFVLTGGEPLLQPNLSGFIEQALKNDWTVGIETNGYFWPDALHNLMVKRAWVRGFAEGSSLVVVISPKVNSRKIYPDLPVGMMQHATCLKCVVEDVPESPYFNLPPYWESFQRIKKRTVYVSPIAAYARKPDPNTVVTSIWPPTPLDLEQTRKNYNYAARLCMEFGLVLSMQTHLFAAVE